MNKKLRTYSLVCLIALFVLLGQGCAGGESGVVNNEAEADAAGDTQLMGQKALAPGPAVIFDVPMPVGMKDVEGPLESTPTDRLFRFDLPEAGLVTTRGYFLQQLPKTGWEITDDRVTNSQVRIRAQKRSREILVDIDPNESGVEVGVYLQTNLSNQ